MLTVFLTALILKHLESKVMKKILTLTTLFLLATHAFAQQEIRQTIYFDFASSTLGQQNTKRLDSLIAVLGQKPEYIVNLRGHTDAIGSEYNNGNLATDRCYAVRTYLISKNIPANRITVESLGESIPAASNSSDAGRALNRRVELIVRIPKAEPVAPPLPALTGDNEGGAAGSNTGTILKPGPNNVGGYGLEVITNTNQMQAMGITTMTDGNQPLISNVMVCISSVPADTAQRKPITVLVPASNNPFCKGPDVKFYDSKTDSSDGNSVKWMLLAYPDLKPVTVNGVDYYEWTYTPRPGPLPCKNADCPAAGNYGEIKLSSKKLLITSVEIIYPEANALLKGTVKTRNRWNFRYFSNDSISSPQVKVIAKDANGREYIADVLLRDLKKNRKGFFVLKRKLFVPKA